MLSFARLTIEHKKILRRTCNHIVYDINRQLRTHCVQLTKQFDSNWYGSAFNMMQKLDEARNIIEKGNFTVDERKLNVNSSLISETSSSPTRLLYHHDSDAVWSVPRNFLVIAETTPKQLSLKLPRARTVSGAALWRCRDVTYTGIRCKKSRHKTAAIVTRY